MGEGHGADVLLVVAVAGVVAVDAVAAGAGPLGWVLLLAAAALLVVRRRAPRLVLGGCVGLVLAYGMGVDAGLFAATPVLVALYTAVAAGYRLVAVCVAAPLVAGAVGTALKAGAPVQEALLPAGWLVAAVLLGEVARHRVALVRSAEQRAAEAERTREETAARRATEERLRVARELHDSLTHSISVIKVRAGVAVHLARKRGEDVPDALLAIQEASRDAARELRETLGLLRADAAGLDRLPALVERTRGTGLDVTVTVSGAVRPLPAEVDLAAYRIVQEALTNVTRHAGATSAAVTVAHEPRLLTVRVDDDGTAGEEGRLGVGLTGMRERVAALGGALRTGPAGHGGFTVQAELPLEATP